MKKNWKKIFIGVRRLTEVSFVVAVFVTAMYATFLVGAWLYYDLHNMVTFSCEVNDAC